MRCEYVSTPCGLSSPRSADEAKEVARARRLAPLHAATPRPRRRRVAQRAWRQEAATAFAPRARARPRPMREPARGRDRAGERQPEHARGERRARRARDRGHSRQAGDDSRRQARLSASAESAARSWRPRNDGYRQPGVPRREDVDAEELEPARRQSRRRSRGRRSEHERQVLGPADEEWHGQHEQGVLEELEEAHEVVVETSVVERYRAERLEGEPAEEKHPGSPERSCRP